MLEINSLDDIRGNTVAIYSIKTMLKNKNFPKFSIISGREGVGKSSVAKIIADRLDESGLGCGVINFGEKVDMSNVKDTVFSMAPVKAKSFIFEELQGLDRAGQTALLNMIDTQPSNVYIICTTTNMMRLSRPLKSRATKWEFRTLDRVQLMELAKDYLNMNGCRLSDASLDLLVRSCRGIPRDLISNMDFALSGNFSVEELSALVGQVPDDIMFGMFMTLGLEGPNVALNIKRLMDQQQYGLVEQVRDYWTRFLLATLSGSSDSISSENIKALKMAFPVDKREKVTNALIQATNDTLFLVLLRLNMQLHNVSNDSIVGEEKHMAMMQESKDMNRIARSGVGGVGVAGVAGIVDEGNGVRVTGEGLRNMKL